MSDFVDVGALSDFPDGRGHAVPVCGVKVAVFRLGDQVYALLDACPHMGASLADGKIHDLRISCHWHGWTFSLLDGKTTSSSWVCARRYEAKVEAGRVLLKAPEDPPEPEPEDDEWIVWDDDKHLKNKG